MRLRGAKMITCSEKNAVLHVIPKLCNQNHWIFELEILPRKFLASSNTATVFPWPRWQALVSLVHHTRLHVGRNLNSLCIDQAKIIVYRSNLGHNYHDSNDFWCLYSYIIYKQIKAKNRMLIRMEKLKDKPSWGTCYFKLSLLLICILCIDNIK